MSAGVWSEELMCEWQSMAARNEHELDIHLPELNCTDMRGCISFAMKVLPAVRLINVYAAGKPDIMYRKDHGGWTPICQRGSR